MKKIIALIISMVTVLSLFSFSVSAQGEEEVDDTVVTCNPGSTVVVTFELPDEYEDIISGSVEFICDESNMKLASAEWALANTFIKNVDINNRKGVFAFSSAQKVGGEIFAFKFSVNNSAILGDYKVSANFKLLDSNNDLTYVSEMYTVRITEYVEVDDPTAPADFKAAVAAISAGTKSEDTFAAIANAVEIYGKLTADEKAQVTAEYQALIAAAQGYNEVATSVNEEAKSGFMLALSSVGNMVAYLNQFIESLIDKAWK